MPLHCDVGNGAEFFGLNLIVYLSNLSTVQIDLIRREKGGKNIVKISH